MIPQDNILCRSLSIFFNLMLVAFWKGFGLEKKSALSLKRACRKIANPPKLDWQIFISLENITTHYIIFRYKVHFLSLSYCKTEA